MDKKKRTILIILVAVLALGGILYAIIDARITAKRKAEAEQLDRKVIMEVLQPFMEQYGFEDMVCNSANYSPSVSAVVTSQSFGEAPDEVKLAFLADVEYQTEHGRLSQDYGWRTSKISSSGLSLKVISGDYSYMESVDGEKSELRRADASAAYSTSMYSPYKDVILRMETLHAKDVKESLDKYLAKDECYMCNGTGTVKYYYGGSDLEALVDGHEASWYGQCGSCGGKGYTRD